MATQWTAIVLNTPVSEPSKVDGYGSFAEAEAFTRQKLSVVLGLPLASLSLSSIQPACQLEWTHCNTSIANFPAKTTREWTKHCAG